MSQEKPASVSIVNCPSDNERHSGREWRDHIARERDESLHDIRRVRAVLSHLTIRSFAELFCFDEPEVRAYLLEQLDPDLSLGDLKVDYKTMRKLADTLGGQKTKTVVERSPLREVSTDGQSVADQQVELLRALLKTMDPAVVKRAIGS